MAGDGKREKDTVAMAAKTFFFSLKNSMSEISRKKNANCTCREIKFKYKFLQFYQGLFMFFFSVLMYKDVSQQTC